MRYRVEVMRSGRWWAIELPGHPGVHSQARRLDQVPVMAADALSLAYDKQVSPHLIDIELVRAGKGLDDIVADARAAREAAERAREEASSLMRKAVEQGIAAGLPLRDIGRLLGVTHQRVAAIARETVA